MKQKSKITDKDFDTVSTFRAIKEKMSLEMSAMNFEQIKEYLKKRSTQFQPIKHSVLTLPVVRLLRRAKAQFPGCGSQCPFYVGCMG